MRNLECVPEWKRIARRAWSVRLALLAALLSGAEIALPLLAGPDPDGWLSGAAALAAVAAAVARVVAQPELWK